MPKTVPPPANLELLQRFLLDAVEQHQTQPSSDAVAPAPKRTTFYTFSDKGGTQNIVDVFERIPQSYRTQAKEWILTPATIADPALGPTRTQLDLPSMLLGGGVAAFAFLVLFLLKRLRWLLWIGLLVAGTASVGGAYWLGLRPSPATARHLLDRARAAIQQMQQATDQHRQAAKPEARP